MWYLGPLLKCRSWITWGWHGPKFLHFKQVPQWCSVADGTLFWESNLSKPQTSALKSVIPKTNGGTVKSTGSWAPSHSYWILYPVSAQKSAFNKLAMWFCRFKLRAAALKRITCKFSLGDSTAPYVPPRNGNTELEAEVGFKAAGSEIRTGCPGIVSSYSSARVCFLEGRGDSPAKSPWVAADCSI